VHGNVVEASWLALVDAVAYAGLRQAALSDAGLPEPGFPEAALSRVATGS
jgi:hypothetical protein